MASNQDHMQLDPTQSQASAQDDQSSDESIMQKKPKTFLKLKMLVAFRIAYQWHDVGIQLGFDTEELEVIDENNKRLPVIECCKTLLSFWKRSGKNFTAEKLIDAVKQGAGNAAYAAELRTDNEIIEVTDKKGNVTKEQKILTSAYLRNKVAGRIAPEWFDVGLCLEIPADKLAEIKQLTNPCGGKCNDMLFEWFRRDENDPVVKHRPTWQNIYDAMCDLDMINAAEDLKNELQPAVANDDDDEEDDFDMN